MQSVSCAHAVISAGGDVFAGAPSPASSGAGSGAGSTGAFPAAVDGGLAVVAHAIGQVKSSEAVRAARFEICMVMDRYHGAPRVYTEADP